MTNQIFRCIALLLVMLVPAVAPAQADNAKLAPTVTIEELNRLIGGPTLISLHFKNAAPKTVFAELARQAGVPIDVSFFDRKEKTLPPVSIDIEKQPFWVALRSLCVKTNVNVIQYLNASLAVDDNANSLTRGPVSLCGPVLIVADSVDRFDTLNYWSSSGSKKEIALHLRVIVDPKLRLIDVASASRLDTVLDEKARPLFAPKSRISGGSIEPFTYANSVDVRSEHAPADSRRIAKLKGTAKLFVAVKIERWEVPDILHAKNVVKTVKRAMGDSQYIVREVKATDHDYEVHLSVSRREFDLLDEFPSQTNFEQQVHLFDTQGRALYREQFQECIGDETDLVSCVVPFKREPAGAKNRPDAPQKLVIEIPEVRVVEVPFEFTDLPLP